MAEITLLQRREIEAGVIAPLYRAMVEQLGEDQARAILLTTIDRLAHDSGCLAAERTGGNDLAHLKQAVSGWTAGNALELTIIRDEPDQLAFDVTRCRYAEMYRRLGLAELGPLLSCRRDAAMMAGFNPRIRLERSQTIMEGADHCPFRFHLDPTQEAHGPQK